MDYQAKVAYPPATRPGNIQTDQDRLQALKAVSMPLDDLQKTIDNARARIESLASTVGQAADRLLGAEGPGEPTGPEHPPRAGSVGNLLDSAEYLHTQITGLERQIARLGCLVQS